MLQPDNLRLGMGNGALGIRHGLFSLSFLFLQSSVPTLLMKIDIERVNLCEF